MREQPGRDCGIQSLQLTDAVRQCGPSPRPLALANWANVQDVDQRDELPPGDRYASPANGLNGVINGPGRLRRSHGILFGRVTSGEESSA
jgi:hypothetical protein